MFGRLDILELFRTPNFTFILTFPLPTISVPSVFLLSAFTMNSQDNIKSGYAVRVECLGNPSPHCASKPLFVLKLLTHVISQSSRNYGSFSKSGWYVPRRIVYITLADLNV